MSDAELWTITTGEDLNRRIRESGQSIEHDRERGYFLSQTHERISPIAVAERRLGIERMKEKLGTDRLADRQQQQQQTRDWVGDMVKRMEEIEREKPAQDRPKERGEERER